MPRGKSGAGGLGAGWRWLAAALLFALTAAAPPAAEPLPQPTGPVILVVSGAVAVTNSGRGAEFDRDMLYALGLTEVSTTTAWTDGVQHFQGVLLRDVLERVGAVGTTITGLALNDYRAPIPFEDAALYDVLLATVMNGAEMQVRDRGPLWIVYPRDAHPELQEPQYNDRWVWQLRELQVQ
ncbi:molybdopterin-dependent oxidoreductase [Devosia albogilva]|uniref:Molybdopterin-dependent oxidoreductase n=1 Tax=Devosia albogilva TaxID=429726 RepID=A0ABW5QJT7_9HYPH